MKRKRLFRKWIITAPLGLIFIGAGLCMVGEANFMKHNETPFWDWVSFGTLSLIVFNAGVCIFGQAIIYRIKYDILVNKKSHKQ